MPSFTRAAPLIAWMHDAYLSELLLRGCTPRPAAIGAPRPRKAPAVVAMEWGLVVPDRPTQLDVFQVRAEGVSAWTLDGAWDKHGELQIVDVTDAATGLALALRAPGAITLEAARVAIEPGPRRRYAPPPRPDPRSLLIWGPRPVSWDELWGWLAPPADAALFRQRPAGNVHVDDADRQRPIVAPYLDAFRIQHRADDPVPLLFVTWMLAATMPGHYLSLTRTDRTDPATWSRALRLPHHLGACDVLSGNVRTTAATWLSTWVPRLDP